MRISDWSSDVCSSDLQLFRFAVAGADAGEDLPLAQFSGVEFETQQHVVALDEFAGHALAEAQVQSGEVVDAAGGDDPPGSALCRMGGGRTPSVRRGRSGEIADGLHCRSIILSWVRLLHST